ncbi:GyrI-like domain-containing protein [Aquimarina macrocephali]|uniref:GyrI-like domain-containing protein n=1 Tax=Aquimarina macrocephali TaxID=666563 RepID=UPI000463DF40|nr:GyrI-like domain-containing protein [Aquimarina macrocephali]
MKHEWRKKEKGVYLPKNTPEIIEIPEYKFLTIEGEGNPNSEFFSEHIGVLYAVSYGIKMGLKKGTVPKGYFDYTVYPLEGVWDITEEAKKAYKGTINKDDLVFKLMIRQPDFIDDELARHMIDQTKKKKPHVLLEKVKFEKITEGKCIQMMHLGSYDNEPESFKIMEEFADKENLYRPSKVHREIYLSDFRKVPIVKLKTVLRFKVVSK